VGTISHLDDETENFQLASQIMAANMDADSVSLITSLHKILESVINKTDITPQGQISEKKLQKPR
jgi:hypothetical protein